MRRVNERGLSSAVIRGWQVARGDVLAVIDADLQHPPEVTAKLCEEMSRGADLAVGQPPRRRRRRLQLGHATGARSRAAPSCSASSSSRASSGASPIR